MGSTTGNLTWGDGESGSYSFDATGAPAVGGNNLTYAPGDIKKRSVESTIQVKDTGEMVSQDFMILMQTVLLLRVLHDWPTILEILRSEVSKVLYK